MRHGAPRMDDDPSLPHSSVGLAPISRGQDYTTVMPHVTDAQRRQLDDLGYFVTDVLFDEPGELSYARWLAALGRGRTTLAAGAGTRLNLRVNGARIGDEIRVRSGRSVRVTLESRQPEPTQLVVLANGVPAASAQVEAGPQAAALDLQLNASAWLQATTPFAATSPVYVLVGRGGAAAMARGSYLSGTPVSPGLRRGGRTARWRSPSPPCAGACRGSRTRCGAAARCAAR